MHILIHDFGSAGGATPIQPKNPTILPFMFSKTHNFRPSWIDGGIAATKKNFWPLWIELVSAFLWNTQKLVMLSASDSSASLRFQEQHQVCLMGICPRLAEFLWENVETVGPCGQPRTFSVFFLTLLFFLFSQQDILHYASKIVKIALGGQEGNGVGTAEKRNSGLLNTVIDMPDLDRFGRRK